MTKEDVLKLSDKEFREWMVRLCKEKRIEDIYKISKIRLGGSNDAKGDITKGNR